jgi:hypothetical protein
MGYADASPMTQEVAFHSGVELSRHKTQLQTLAGWHHVNDAIHCIVNKYTRQQ